MIKCQICGKEYKSIQPLSKHITAIHNIDKKLYYDMYLKQLDEGICHRKNCNKETSFYGMNRGYNKYCSKYCQVKAQGNGAKIDHTQMWKIRRQHIHNYEITNNCINLGNAINKYGRRVYDCINDLSIPIIKVSKMYQYIDNYYIPIIEDFINNYHRLSGTSNIEKQIAYRLNFNGNIIQNTKAVIYPYELDIWIPDIKLAIEFNGTWHHSIEAGTSKDYHLRKSLLCREKGIRLIHIYEFEDFDEQINLINQLLLGYDNFPKEDFNKNNLIDPIPSIELIHTSSRGYHIYGAGPLY